MEKALTMKKILGLDLGTNSIGWATITSETDEDGREQFKEINHCGSRIIPLDQATLGDFNRGNTISQTAERTRFRGVRRLYERANLRRERLNRVLSILEWLPEHYSDCLDRYGKFLPEIEPKLAWSKDPQGKMHFVYANAFSEMLEDFRKSNPDYCASGRLIPYDWTLYYLRKKALTRPVSKQELAWILLSFNQKRGYNHARGEDWDEDGQEAGKVVTYQPLKIIGIVDTGEKKGTGTWHQITLENGMVYKRVFTETPNWIDETKDFIVTTEKNPDGSLKKDKEGNVKYSLRLPNPDDWTLKKKKTEGDIQQSHKTVGEYIYDSLLQNPSQKIRGSLVHTVERSFYREELIRILEKQKEFLSDLNNPDLYQSCIQALYPSNTAYRNSISTRGFTYLFVDDILFYQRPLKSKKSLVDDCPYETRKDKSNKTIPVKCVPRSHPAYQEFRLWQFISNLRIYERETGRDVTYELLPDTEHIAALYEWMSDRESIDQKNLLASPVLGLKKSVQTQMRWNYVEDKAYPCNETRASILNYLNKAGIQTTFLTREKEEALWHIFYSVSNKQEIKKALKRFATKEEQIPLDCVESFVGALSKMPPYDNSYGAYSLKAIRKLLPLMRAGKYWNESSLLSDKGTSDRINRIITGEYDPSIQDRVRQQSDRYHLERVTDFQNLPVWLACYIVYNRHSEAKDTAKWENPDDLDTYLRSFKQHSLHNPIVESVVTETLRTVRDIWKEEGHIDEIHIELGREMKNPADKRRIDLERQLRNENANLRIRAMLMEFMNPEFEVENVRPYSPSQQEILRIYEETALNDNSLGEIPDDIVQTLDKFRSLDLAKRPTRSEVLRYKLWLEQRYRSPYTGEIIPLGKLFTAAYEIEHIIPQSVYFDDSFNNKVICESSVNKEKGNLLGLAFIKEKHGMIVQLGNGRSVRIFEVAEYEKFVKDHYGSRDAASKKRNLLADEIPETFIHRQLNDTRYISKLVKSILSNIVRGKDEQDGISRNVITCTGGVTDRLKKDWGINDLWKQLLLPRFERMQKICPQDVFVTVNQRGNRVPCIPDIYKRGNSLKRLDHRHHAMDAIVIACATRNMVSYLNNESACRGARISRFDLQRLLCDKVRQEDAGNYTWVIRKPGADFIPQVRKALEDIIVSFKQNLRVINKTSNRYQHIADGKKILVPQTKGGSWAIRKSMHKDTVFGEVNLRLVKTVSLNDALKQPERIVRKDIKSFIKALGNIPAKTIKAKLADAFPGLSRLEIYYFSKETSDRYYATRKNLDDSFDKAKIEDSVTDSGIRKILIKHLELNNGDPKRAFSPEGIEAMNRNLQALNGGKAHQPIFKVRCYEKANKFPVGETGNKAKKFVEAAKGTNLFYAVYNGGEGQRTFESIPLNIAILREKSGDAPVPETDAQGNTLLFYLSPNDLVYLPTPDELEIGRINYPIDRGRIYKMVSSSGRQCFFLPHRTSAGIIDKQEYTTLNKMERAITGEMIKEICIPIKVDRLGKITQLSDKTL